MRRISRLERSIDASGLHLRAPRRSPYVCSTCRHQITSFSTSTIRASPRKLPMTESIRRKIWGTDAPPGLEDPYGDSSRFDQTKKRTRRPGSEGALQEVRTRDAGAVTDAADDSTYEPATTWDGLEEVGVYAGHEAWEAEHGFRTGFPPGELMTDKHEITATLHRALVEVFTWQQAGKPFHEISTEEPGDDLTQSVQITPTKDGAELKFTSADAEADLVESLTTRYDDPAEEVVADELAEDSAADESEVDTINEASPVTYEDLIKTWDPSWRSIALTDPELRFAVMKRMLQLSGIRFPDASIKSATTAAAFLTHVIKPPKPRKLIEALAQKEELLNLPNVSVFAKRVTPVDKEKAVGRWKVIERELERRGLPLTGHE